MNLKTIELEFCTVSERPDGIIENRFLEDAPYLIDSNHIIEIAEAMEEISQGKRRAILSVAGRKGNMTPEARSANIDESDRYTIALGLVIHELSQRLLAKLYFKIKNTKYPIKTFKTEEDAVQWLRECIEAKKAC